jgi:hypothetical protein
MLVCDKCGKKTTYSELPVDRDIHGYTSLGQPLVEETLNTECSCGGVFREGRKCEICGEYFYDKDVLFVCEDCLDDEMTVENAVKIGDSNRNYDVALNGFIVEILGEEKINEILADWILGNHKSLNKIELKTDRYLKEYLEELSNMIRGKVNG